MHTDITTTPPLPNLTSASGAAGCEARHGFTTTTILALGELGQPAARRIRICDGEDRR
jgi:hypothetical protein